MLTVAGRNTKLTAALADLVGTDAVTLRHYDVIDFVDDILVASDLVISKAGGLITSEALARGVPMIVIEPIPGQEEWNADFVVAAGAGLQLRTPEAVAPTVSELLNDPLRLASMRERALDIGRPDAAQMVAEHILHDVRTIPDDSAIVAASTNTVASAKMASLRTLNAQPDPAEGGRRQ
jgi:processive 1,2-diacylglycerol beta-glucosyltransferase